MTGDDLAWHYTDGAGLVSILGGHTLWATSAAFLNDQQEVALGGQRLHERLDELIETDPGGDLAQLVERVGRETEKGDGPRADRFYILSAAQTWDSLALWRLYGGEQESYAIGLDPDAPLSVLADGASDPVDARWMYLGRQPWQAVRYAEQDQRRLLDDALVDLPSRLASVRDALVELSDGPPQDVPAVGGILDDIQEALLLIKHEGFVDERETRYCVVLVARPDDPQAVALETRIVRYRATGYGIAPYVRLTGSPADGAPITTTPGRLPVRAVAVSPSPHGPAAEGSVARLLAARGYGGVPVLRSGIPFRG